MFEPIEWRLAHGRSLTLGPKAVIMGVLNVTPDSFSDGGRFSDPSAALAQARRMVEAGAGIIDIGGESTRPGARPVGAGEEQDRVLPIVSAVARALDVAISVDTYRAQTAQHAVGEGAHIVNDVWGAQREPDIAAVAAATGAGLVLMHTGRERERHRDVIKDQHAFLTRSLEIAAAAGVPDDRVLLDPGFGFAKDEDENLELMARFGGLRSLARPWLVGTSRKRFIGHVTGREAGERDAATAATSVILRLQGAAVFRVHDVAINKDALAIADAMIERGLTARGAL